MTPAQRELARLCRSLGVPYGRAERLLPLVRRALDSPPELRRRIRAVVLAALKREAGELTQHKRLQAHLNRSYLDAVAQVLQTWEPRIPPPAEQGRP